MQAAIRTTQARPRAHRRQILEQIVCRLMAVSGELLALASLTTALGLGLLVLESLVR